jgi:hypothetical protein
MMRALLVTAFLLGAGAYVLLFVGCLGTEAGSTLSQTCSALSPLLKTPLLYWLPHASSRYLGIDSMVLAGVGNALLWGVAFVALTYLILRMRNKKAAAT